jgi:hypothetical protein
MEGIAGLVDTAADNVQRAAIGNNCLGDIGIGGHCVGCGVLAIHLDVLEGVSR